MKQVAPGENEFELTVRVRRVFDENTRASIEPMKTTVKATSLGEALRGAAELGLEYWTFEHEEQE